MKIGMSLGMRGQRGLSQIQRAIAFLRSLGTSAHVWPPGANGVSVASLPSNNYLLSDGSTGYSTVDGVDGLTLDALGALGSELVTNGTFTTDTSGWAGSSGATIAAVAGQMEVTNGTTNYGVAAQVITTVVGKTYCVVADGRIGTTSQIRLGVGTSAGTTTHGYLFYTTGTLTSSKLTFVATTTTTYLSAINQTNTIGHTGYVDNISVKEYTGTHLTQATTANRPLVRRGMLNLITQSASPNNAAWTKVGTAAAPNSTTVNLPAVNDGIYDAVTVSAAAGSIWTSAFILSGTGTTTISVIRTAGGNYEEVLSAITLTATPTLYAVTLTLVGAQTALAPAIVRKTAQTATTVTFDGGGLFAGTWTAAQILAEGGIPTTTATAASNTAAGKYWWSFDGSNDSLLSGNLGITNACTIVMSLRVNSLAATQTVFAEDTNGVQISIATDGSVSLTKVGGAALVTTAAGVVVAGTPLVLTARLSAGTAVIRKNGTQSVTAASALTFSATTGARIGTAFNGTTSPTGGAIGWVVPSAVGLSDADCLPVERLAASQFPNGPIF